MPVASALENAFEFHFQSTDFFSFSSKRIIISFNEVRLFYFLPWPGIGEQYIAI